MREFALVLAVAFTALLALTALPARAQAPAPSPEALFKGCLACHNERSDASGPTLRGVVGRKVGSVPGFRYSNAMKRADFIWTPEKLTDYLKDPQGVVRGNRMPYAGITSDAELNAIVSYLKSLE